MKNHKEFKDFRNKVYEIMKDNYGLEPNDMGEDQIRTSFEGNESPKEFCEWFAIKYDLDEKM